MEFRVLGPLEVEDGGLLLPLRGRRQRALLALLLLHANEVVPDDRLLQDLWGDEQPASGRAALRVRISQLRKGLGDGGASLLTRPPGYVLRAEPDRIDARLFERLLAEGRRRLAGGEAEPAALTLRQALGLWRGPALADVAYETFAQGEIARLEELRRAALEERIEADLALGREAELVGELEALAAADPLRERLRAQHMLALYRSGRQADALAAYRDARRLLVDELGIEPGRALAELESAILRQDPALELPPPPAREPAPAAEAPLREQKLVTVLAACIAGAPSDRQPLREAMEEEIAEAGGHLEAVAGDTLTAVFGAPVAQEDHGERALHAALALRRRLGGTLALHIGVDAGEVVVGRSPDGATTLVGEPLAAAARLAQRAGAGTILVGERAVASSRGVFEFGAASDGDGVPPGRPLVRELSLTRTQGLGGLDAAFVGRRGELDLLRSLYLRAVEDASPRLVTVTGDAGVGKSRLTRELWDWLAGESPEPLRRTGRCLPYGRGTTYRPLADVLREHLGLLETDECLRERGKLAGREILGLALGLDVAPDLHPLQAREQLHSAWVELLGELTAEQPVVMLIEDLHWAQEPLLELLERLLDDVAGPLLLVATARPELAARHPAWGRRRDAATVWLEPLSPEDSELLLDALLRDDAPADLRRAALERAEGNPFFLEELLAGVHDHSLPLETEVPDSVQAVLAARIDLLPPTEKAALQAASVIGRVFWRGPVRELVAGEAPDFAVLEARDFIRRRSASSLAGERDLAFKHALTREVAYAGLPRARRARLHAGFAGWLEGRAGGRDEQAPFLAHHYAEAVRPEDADLAWADHPEELERLRGRAVAWLARAAELAVSRYELDEAIALYERALPLEDGDEGRSELWRGIGRATALKFDGEAFWTAMQNAIELAPDERRGDLAAELALETFLRSGMYTQRPALERIDYWIDYALERTGPGSRARAQALVAKAFSDVANGDEAAAEAEAIAEALDDPVLRAVAWDARHGIAMDAGDYEAAWHWGRRRQELLDSIADPDLQADIVATPIRALVALGHFQEARESARRNDEITRPLTPHHRVHGVSVLIEVEELLGCWEQIASREPRVRDAVAANASTPCTRNARSLLLVALAHEYLGDDERARELEAAAGRLEMENRQVIDAPRLRLALARGERATVEELTESLLADEGWYSRGHGTSLATLTTLVDGLGALGRRDVLEERAAPLLGRSVYLDPFVLRALGLAREDEAGLAEALARFSALGLTWHAEQTHALG